ncbi:MAG: Ig-like domain-containing protein [Gemmataceae bacterium]|nr:Ig-like domain-containing protein [Gemmataceae bacterium]
MGKFRTRLQVEGLDQRWLPSGLSPGSAPGVVATALMPSRTTITPTLTWPINSDTPTSVTLTASVGGGLVAPTTVGTMAITRPTGSVRFYYDGAVVGAATLDATGTARLTLPGPSLGQHPVKAEYLGDAQYAPSVSRDGSVGLERTTRTTRDVTETTYLDGNGGGSSGTASAGSTSPVGAAAAPPAPPTADTLTWDDYPKVPSSQWSAGTTIQNVLERGETETVVTTRDSNFKATAEARIKVDGKVTPRAVLVRDKSFVVRGQESDELLEHERLHLRISEYIALKAAGNVPDLSITATVSVQGDALNDPNFKARDAALAKARADYVSKGNAFMKKWNDIVFLVQKQYDSETDHGNNVAAQAAWFLGHYTVYADLVMKGQGWKV